MRRAALPSPARRSWARHRRRGPQPECAISARAILRTSSVTRRRPGRIVMVRHEYPFAPGHVHRRVKLAWAQEMGAVGFLIAHPERGVGPVSGSSGRNGGAGIPALGIGVEAADALRPLPDGTLPSARMVIDGEDHPARTHMLVADLPGRGPDWVVVSAHIDGHPHGESAMDNATGVAVALGLARLLAPHVSECPRGL